MDMFFEIVKRYCFEFDSIVTDNIMYIFSLLMDKIFSLMGNADNTKYHITNNFQRKSNIKNTIQW